MAEEALMTPEQLTKTQACDWSVIANWRAKARVVDKRLKEQTGNAFERSKSEGAQEIKVEYGVREVKRVRSVGELEK